MLCLRVQSWYTFFCNHDGFFVGAITRWKRKLDIWFEGQFIGSEYRQHMVKNDSKELWKQSAASRFNRMIMAGAMEKMEAMETINAL
jgi:hypothetical protein